MATPSHWKKSSYSGGGEGNDCVEVATSPTRISIRDSKAPAESVLNFPTGAFTSFIEALKPDFAPAATSR
ncbi:MULTISPECIES: DUF397 domain-containing protein [unclassified Streptomyces]|uniref:DUF397 domain-containing protein n=1 Tax=Streptomyces sp. NPDC059517 TaxID=3346855 RepID=UPI0036759A1E